MAVVVAATSVTSGSSNTDATSYATASITPVANRLYLLAVSAGSPALGGTPPVPTATGAGLTWVAVNNQDYGLAATTPNRLALLRALGTAPTSGAVTISFAGDTQAGCSWSIVEFTDIDVGGTNGSRAIVQTAKVRANLDGAPVVTLAAFDAVDNATYGCFGTGNSPAPQWTPGAGFTEIHDVGGEGGVVLAEFQSTNDTSVDATAAGVTPNTAGIAVEIRAQIAPPKQYVFPQAVKRAADW